MQLYTGKNTQLVFACWQAWTWLSWPAWTWLSWPAWTVLLTGLFVHVGTDCSWLDERTDMNNVVGTIMMNQQSCLYMIEDVVREWRNNKIEQRCYNNHELGCCIKSGLMKMLHSVKGQFEIELSEYTWLTNCNLQNPASKLHNLVAISFFSIFKYSGVNFGIYIYILQKFPFCIWKY